MSSARHAVHRADSFTGFGNRPDLTPSHQQVLPSGITLSTCGNRKNPVCGISCIATPLSVPTSWRRTSVQLRSYSGTSHTVTPTDPIILSKNNYDVAPKVAVTANVRTHVSVSVRE